jgi:hypothetical protein
MSDIDDIIAAAGRFIRPFTDREVATRNRGRGAALGEGRRVERAGRTAAEAARDTARGRGLVLGEGRRAERAGRVAAEAARDTSRARGLALGAGRRVERAGRVAAESARDAALRVAATNKGRAAKVLKLASKLRVGNKTLRRALTFGLPAAGIVAGGAGFAGGYIKGKKDAPTKVIRPPFEDIPRPGVNAPSFRGADTSGIVSGGSAPSSGGGQSYRGGQSSMTDTMKRNQRAVRDAESYLGEAFDATVQKGVQTGRKHLAAMLQRDGVDNETGTRIMKKYENSIAGQESLRGYKSRGLTEEFDAENPNKKGALLEAYRGKYAKGTTLQQMREKASASR